MHLLFMSMFFCVLRLQIVPTSKAYTVEKLIDAIDYHNSQTNREVLIEYICIGNVNCSSELQHELGRLLKGKTVIVNLIPYNPTEIGDESNFESPTGKLLNFWEPKKIILKNDVKEIEQWKVLAKFFTRRVQKVITCPYWNKKSMLG